MPKWQTDTTGEVANPYSLLPPLGVPDYFDEDDTIDEGGIASMAFAKIQYGDMCDADRARIRPALLRYCELDTLAMVMIWQHWESLMDR